MKVKKVLAIILSALAIFQLVVIGASAQETTVNYVALGDSIAAGTKLFNADVQAYGAIISKTTGWNYANYAVPGHTTYAFLNRLDEQAVQQAVTNADIISVSIGGNNFLLNGMVDMLADGLLNNDYSKMDDIILDFTKSFDECIKKIKALNPDAELFVQTLYNPMTGKVGEVYAQGQQRLNLAYKQYLQDNPGEYTLVDIEPLFENHTDYIATDYIHPNKKGHLVIANEYIRVFNAMGLTQAQTATEPTIKDICNIDILDYIKDIIFEITNAFNLMFGGLSDA